ncbi:MAG TPA: hypothetical protein VHS29_09415 [Candidatus Acidoferrales bacterium]|nr:hypothetical protein [Candidatus Acidoferrales bacterium]
MRQKEEVVALIQKAFVATPYPGDAFLQGSFDGCEPYDEVGAFVGQMDWGKLGSKMLDAHYCALSFFSEGGFRFFLPAFLIANLHGELLTADPLLHLCHGFAPASVEVPVGPEIFRRDSGGNTLLNPKRYGAMTWSDYACHRLSVFTREEAKAIVAYMIYKRERDSSGLDKLRIDAALNEFWLDRAENAPTRDAVEAHVQEEARFTAALQAKREEKP